MQLKNILNSIHLTEKKTLKKDSTIWLNEKQKEAVRLYGLNNMCKWFFDVALQNYYQKKMKK